MAITLLSAVTTTTTGVASQLAASPSESFVVSVSATGAFTSTVILQQSSDNITWTNLKTWLVSANSFFTDTFSIDVPTSYYIRGSITSISGTGTSVNLNCSQVALDSPVVSYSTTTLTDGTIVSAAFNTPNNVPITANIVPRTGAQLSMQQLVDGSGELASSVDTPSIVQLYSASGGVKYTPAENVITVNVGVSGGRELYGPSLSNVYGGAGIGSSITVNDLNWDVIVLTGSPDAAAGVVLSLPAGQYMGQRKRVIQDHGFTKVNASLPPTLIGTSYGYISQNSTFFGAGGITLEWITYATQDGATVINQWVISESQTESIAGDSYYGAGVTATANYAIGNSVILGPSANTGEMSATGVITKSSGVTNINGSTNRGADNSVNISANTTYPLNNLNAVHTSAGLSANAFMSTRCVFGTSTSIAAATTRNLGVGLTQAGAIAKPAQFRLDKLYSTSDSGAGLVVATLSFQQYIPATTTFVRWTREAIFTLTAGVWAMQTAASGNTIGTDLGTPLTYSIVFDAVNRGFSVSATTGATNPSYLRVVVDAIRWM